MLANASIHAGAEQCRAVATTAHCCRRSHHDDGWALMRKSAPKHR
eukprot:COSAG06_NODE_3197_length_5701_cov_5.984470_8_plen_45_part_00